MIDSLDEIDWSALDHAYGHAGDTPGLIRQLRKDDWSEAVEELLASILHQGGVYPATVAALPFLHEVATDQQAQGRIGALQLLCFYGQSVAAGLEDPRIEAEARAGLAASARILLPLAEDPDPEVRIAVYECASYWNDPAALEKLRERLAAESDRPARVALIEPLARHGLLRSADLETLLADDQDEVLFAALWCALALGVEMPGALDHLVRLWPTQAQAYPGLGASNSLALLVQRAGARALPLLEILAQRPGSGLSVGDLAYAWCDVAQISRSATGSALDALIALAKREESAELASAQPIVAALASVLAAAEERRSPMADALAGLLERVSAKVPGGERPGVPAPPALLELQASVAWLLFALQDPRWAVPARAAVATGAHLMVSTGLNSSTSFPVQLARVCAFRPVAWARTEIIEVTRTALRARPAADGAWAEVLGQLPPGADVLEVLLENLSPASEPVVPKILAQLAAAEPEAFPAEARDRIRALVPDQNEAGAWLLTVQHLIDPAPETFAQVWELAGATLDADELLRIWAAPGVPALERACQEQFTGRARNSFPERHRQLAAAAIVLEIGDPAAVRAAWPTVRAVLDRAGEPLTRAATIAEQMVRLDPALRPEWVAQLRDILSNGRESWSEPDHVATALAIGYLAELGELTAEEAVQRALAVEVEAVRTGRAVRVTPVVAGVLEFALRSRPDLQPVVAQALEPLVRGDERIPAPADEIATDTHLVRILQNVVFGGPAAG
ncbi:HEAT repeat domain-containing protein [Kineosporia babensis]|uniref:HEAT repeat domain-containing protein n=1 Tax=Kineosporia babensis TaxID=499548 RepID=A0A9X1NCQ7_9ACTN|nr:HEAT repeat domain-containing protein [Kineosporia babensis]MCD5311708.1 HEAT repeat domain-containing protein [Kineosporia babensis]